MLLRILKMAVKVWVMNAVDHFSVGVGVRNGVGGIADAVHCHCSVTISFFKWGCLPD